MRIKVPDFSAFQDAAGNWSEENWPSMRMRFECCDYTLEQDVALNVDGLIRAQCGLCRKEPKITVLDPHEVIEERT